jgi:hypothetical protein
MVFIITELFYYFFLNTYVTYVCGFCKNDGTTVLYSLRGVVVCITRGQNNFIGWLFWIVVVSGSIAALVLLLDPFKSKE